MAQAEVKRLKQLEDENRRLKKLVTDLSLDVAMLKDVAGVNRLPKLDLSRFW